MLEHCGGGDLQHLIRVRETVRLSEGFTKCLVKDSTKGLRHLSGRKVAFRDAKQESFPLVECLSLDKMCDACKDITKEKSR